MANTDAPSGGLPTDVAPIEPLHAGEVPAWDMEADVVVVGLGASGAAATIEAAEAGAEVIALESAAMGGGTSAMSGGIIYLGGGTAVQIACGYSDTPEAMAAFLMAACGPGTDEAKVRAYCDNSVAHFDWLVAHGVPFEGQFHPEHDMEPSDLSGLFYSGGEDSWPFTEVAPPVPRGHHPRIPGAAGGFLMQHLLAAVAATPAQVITDATAQRLVVEGGEVVGLEASVDGATRLLRARGGVVLAAGGFMFNHPMLAQYCPTALKANVPLGTQHDDGRGIRMGQGVGAAVLEMHEMEVATPITPPRPIVRGILVNAKGERFINEDTYFGRIGKEALFNQNAEVYFVHSDDSFVLNNAGYQPQWVAETAEELESEIGLPSGSLAATLERYNEHAAQGSDPEFHKSSDWVIPLEPPYGVIDIGLERSWYAGFTLGGLHTSTDSAVLDATGTAIPGLFAAGRTTKGIAGTGYVSGISLGDGTFFGRRAGLSAATRSTAG
jgi:3-oxo-5alpha-steroid 4-dehydrogenase